MAYKAEFKTTFEPSKIIQPIYTGGSVALSQDGRVLAACVGEDVLLSDLSTGAHLARIEGDGEAITILALAPDASFVTLCSRSLSMRIFALSPSEDAIETQLVRSLKPHTAPVVTATVDSTGTLLATGGADGVVKVEISASDPKHKSRKRKSRSGSEDTIDGLPTETTVGFRLASGGEDGRIRVWDLHKSKSIAVLESHVSVVRSLDFSSEQNVLLSASRDKTAIAWDAKSWQVRSTVPVLEELESAGFVANGEYFYTGGETARIRIWDLGGNERTREQEAGVETEAILDVLHYPSLSFLLSVHADQTLVLHSLGPLDEGLEAGVLSPLPVMRRISGTHDEVIDLAYVGTDKSLLALATNLEDIRLISLDSAEGATEDATRAPYFGADVGLLKGHTDIVITLDTDWSGHWLATGAKDNNAKLWRLDPANSSYTCYATFTGHAESISAVALPHAIPTAGSQAYNKPLEHPPPSS
ncbi:U3 small nucleolar RNA-associated protein 13 [Taxawa tesnikishii (nom. ined.)]|nr:U3 small nucleolar RNA-associated protein 13 [Dothideales sp. JES 119]